MRRLILQLVRIETVAVLVTAWLAGALGLGLATGASAVLTVALMALGPLLGGLLLLLRHNLELASRIGNLANQTTRTLENVRRVGAGIEKDIRQTFRQLEALQNLSALLPASDVLPATRGWAASPDLLVVLVDLAITERPSLILECGSGASTLWLALAMRQFEIDGRIIALDHDPVFAGKTREFLAKHDVGDLAEVRDAPLESFDLDGGTYSWYARRAWEDLTGIDLLFVDGPPAATGHHARYPALPLLSGSLSKGATIVLDDLVVTDMQQVLRLWLDAYPDFGSEILPLEKQAAVLRRSQPTPTPASAPATTSAPAPAPATRPGPTRQRARGAGALRVAPHGYGLHGSRAGRDRQAADATDGGAHGSASRGPRRLLIDRERIQQRAYAPGRCLIPALRRSTTSAMRAARTSGRRVVASIQRR